MQRALSIAFSLGAVALSAVLAFREPTGTAGGEVAAHSPSPSSVPVAIDAGLLADAGVGLGMPASSAAAPDLAEPPAVEVPPGGFHLADGTPVAPLGKGAPRHVRFGVVLVAYEGAEGAPDKGARHKSDAVALANRLADEAKTDFRGTVSRGDSGSDADVGEVTRGVLEPGSEAVLFSLPVGGVSGVFDTPRGFWIVKRLQ
jgi:hypothetical protein